MAQGLIAWASNIASIAATKPAIPFQAKISVKGTPFETTAWSGRILTSAIRIVNLFRTPISNFSASSLQQTSGCIPFSTGVAFLPAFHPGLCKIFLPIFCPAPNPTLMSHAGHAAFSGKVCSCRKATVVERWGCGIEWRWLDCAPA